MKNPYILRNIQKIIAILVGTFISYLGYLLFLKGVSGNASLIAEHLTFKAQLINAAPGLFFMIGGVTIIVIVIVIPEKHTTTRTKKINEPLSKRKITTETYTELDAQEEINNEN